MSEETEVRHSFNVTDINDKLPEAEVPGFRTAVEELAKDLKQLTAMLLTVRFYYVFWPLNFFFYSFFI